MRFLSGLLLGLCGVCSHVVVLDLSVRLSWYPMWLAVTVMRILLFVLDLNMWCLHVCC